MKRFVIFLIALLFMTSCKEKEAESHISFTYTGSAGSNSIEVWPLSDIHPVKVYWGIGEPYNMNHVLNRRSLGSSISLSDDNIGKNYTATLTGMIAALDCGGLYINSIDVSNCSTLLRLDCFMNSLTFLDLSRNYSLSELNCGMNNLSNLDLSKNTALSILNCGSNPITNLDVSNNTALEVIKCYGTQLSSLDVSKCITLKQLDCADSPLSAEALNELFRTLPEVANGKIRITGTTGENDCDKSIATAKGWEFQR